MLQGQICPLPLALDPQPSISVYRESVFGRGELVFTSATEAAWRFYRIDAPLVAADEVTITRHPQTCGQRA